jgi:hypothetical protein
MTDRGGFLSDISGDLLARRLGHPVHLGHWGETLTLRQGRKLGLFHATNYHG